MNSGQAGGSLDVPTRTTRSHNLPGSISNRNGKSLAPDRESKNYTLNYWRYDAGINSTKRFSSYLLTT